MTLLVSDSAEIIMMETFVNKATPEDLILKLYSSNTTPAESDTQADYAETTGGGYASVALIANDWTVTGGNPTVAAYPEIIFTFTGAVGSIYGYYVVQAVSGALMWSEEFSGAPLNVQNVGDEIRVTLNITLE